MHLAPSHAPTRHRALKRTRIARACRMCACSRNGLAASYQYDAPSRITKKLQAVNDNPANPTVLTTAYAYTSAGQLAQVTYPSGLNVYYRRNASGQIEAIDTQRPRTSILRAPAITPLVTNLQYTALQQPKSWSWNCVTGNLYTPNIAANCNSAQRSFDQDGRMSANEFASYQFDAASRITGITQNLYASRTVTQTVGTETSVITELYQTPFSWSAAYDSRSRLTGFNRPGSEQSYSYDANSNRLTSVAKKVSDTDIDGLFEATDRAATTSQSLNIEATSNKLLGFNQSVLTQATAANGTRRTVSNVISQINYQLDANGNLVSDGLRSFEYDAENRLHKVEILRDGEAAKVTYLHNAAGQRVFKSEPQTAQTLPDETTLGTSFTDWLKKNFQWLYATAQQNASIGTGYTYGDGNLPSWAILGEYDNGSASGAGRVEYIWLPTEDGNAIPVAMLRGARYFAIHTDHLGTPRLLKDDTAKPTWQWAYSAFGDNKPTGILKATANPNAAITNQPTLLQATGAMEFNLRFPGQYLDSETGQFYNYFRNYMPNQGRYTQNDPIGLAGGWNRFGYGFANAISNTDPTGLFVPANHNGITAEALRIAGSPCPDLPKMVALADFLPGSQATENSHWHAMRNGRTGETAAQADQRYQQYVNDQMGSCSCAGLARALHAIQDSFSAAHTGFQPWNGNPVPSPAHVFKDSYPSKQTWQQAVNASVAAIRRYKEQCTQCQR